MDGNEAGAWAARLAKVKVVPNFPVTPQTELIETLAKWKVDGLFKGDFLDVESEHSVGSAAIASSATGVRTFTASSSQGLLLMHEVLYVASGMRLPIVMINVSRGLSAPITLWDDHNDILDQRDSGWMIFFTENNQEVIDLTLQAFKIAENHKVLLPCFVNLDGFVLSYTREPVQIPNQKAVDKSLQLDLKRFHFFVKNVIEREKIKFNASQPLPDDETPLKTFSLTIDQKDIIKLDSNLPQSGKEQYNQGE